MINRFNKIVGALKSKATLVAIRSVSSRTTHLTARNDQCEPASTVMDEGHMVEVLHKGQFVYKAIPHLSQEAVQTAVDWATMMAEKSAPWNLFNFDQQCRPNSRGEYSTPQAEPFTGNLTDFMGQLLQLNRALKVSDKIMNRVARCQITERQSYYYSTEGAQICQNMSLVGYDLMATAHHQSEYQTRTAGHPVYQHGPNFFNWAQLIRESQRVGEEAVELLSAAECPEALMDLILTPDQLYLQVHESIGHPLELDRILGDERNYAGHSFVSLADFGKLQYGTPLLNVTFDPTVDHEYGTYAFDDIGNRATREHIIKDGVLVRALGSLESQARAGVPGVANARATSWNRPPIDRMANLNIEPGHCDLNKMIAQVERGVLMQTNRSWSIDDYRRKFQFGCEYGKLIENGKLTKTVKNPNYRGISIPFWNSLKAVGDRSTFELWGTSNCGKGEPNQGIFVGHATPACLFTNIEVFGGK